jgi:predicted DNA-binding transcriptional regulator YafY
MNKTEAYISIIMQIMRSPRRMISKEDLAKKLKKPYSTLQRYLAELKKDILLDGKPLLLEIQNGENKAYTLNESMFKYFYPSHLETAFYLEAYQKLGSLLDHKNLSSDIKELKEEVFQLNGRSEQMKRKFYYLTKTNSTFTDVDLEFQSIIVNALINNQKLKLTYNDKDYDEVYPLTLCQTRDSLYLIAYKGPISDDQIRKFKINRIENIDFSDEIFVYPTAHQWDPEDHFNKSSGLITGKTQTVQIKVYGHSRLHISERSFFNKEQIQTNEEFDHYKLTYTSVEEFLGQLFVYAQDIEIVDNELLRESFRNKARMALQRNTKKAA